MADINAKRISTNGVTPQVHYDVTYVSSRPNNTQMTYNFTIKASLNKKNSGSDAPTIGTGIVPTLTITINDAVGTVALKNTSDVWKNTSESSEKVVATKTLSITTGSTSSGTQTVSFVVKNSSTYTSNAGNVSNSSYTVTSLALLAPGAPSSVVAKQDGSTAYYNRKGSAVMVSWTAGTSASSYNVEVAYTGTDNNTYGDWTSVASPTGTNQTDSSPSTWLSGRLIKYRVQSVNSGIKSDWVYSNALRIVGGMKVKVNGSWKTGTVWTRVGSEWKRANAWTKVNAAWKQSI